MSKKAEFSKKLLWQIWGTLLAAIPFVLRSDFVLIAQVSPSLAPLLYCAPALGGAMAASLFIEPYIGFLNRITLKVWTLICVVSNLVTASMELAWIPFLFGGDFLIDGRPAFDVIGAISQYLSLTGWLALGKCVDVDGDAAFDRDNRFVGICFVSAALSLVMHVLSLVVSSNLFISLAICLASGAGVFCLMEKESHGSPDISLFQLSRCLLCGLAVAAVASDFISGFYIARFDAEFSMAPALLIMALMLLGAIILLRVGLSLAVWLGHIAAPRRVTEKTKPGDCLLALPKADTLSEKEKETILRLVAGESVTFIAKDTSVKPSTVSVYRMRGLKKLGYESVDDLANALSRYGLKNGHCQFARFAVSLVWRSWGILVVLFTANYCRLAFEYAGIVYQSLGLALVCLGMGGLSQGFNMSQDAVPFKSALVSCLLSAYPSLYLYRALRGETPSSISLFVLLCLGFCFSLVHSNLSEDMPKPYTPFSQFRVFLFGCFCLIWGSLQYSPIPAYPDPALLYICLFLTAADVIGARPFARPKEMIDSGHSTDRKRIVSYLNGRGLNELESQVVLLTALGMDRNSISMELNVSVGTVNSYRALSYRALGVHSASELRTLLEKEAGFRTV